MKLKVSTEPAGTREVLLKIEPDSDTIAQAMRKAGRQISRVRPVPGFRPGKAPYAMVERMFGREMILNEALNDVASDLYREAVREAELEAIDSGKLEIETQEPLVLKTLVSLAPVVTLGDYGGLHVDPEPEIALTDEQISAEVARVRRTHAQLETVERPALMGDEITVAIKGTSEGETVVDQPQTTLVLEENIPPPGFAEALAGIAAEQTREFSLAYPEDYENSSLAGKTVQFSVNAKAVRQVNLPPLDDGLAKMAGDYETLEALREALAKSLKERLEKS